MESASKNRKSEPSNSSIRDELKFESSRFDVWDAQNKRGIPDKNINIIYDKRKHGISKLRRRSHQK